MRIYETVNDDCVLPGLWVVVRLDGRGFTGLTRDPGMNFEAPFDKRFSEYMSVVAGGIMNDMGFRFIYGYHQSDEISLLLALDDQTFKRKTRKINSILASYAGAVFTHLLPINYNNSVPKRVAVFDSRVIQLPNVEMVARYFQWRQLDATRNALNSWCYWMLRKGGLSANAATNALLNKTVSEKNEILFSRGVNFNDVPSWQKRGTGLFWEKVLREGYNPIKKEKVNAIRKSLEVEDELPYGDTYDTMITEIIGGTFQKEIKPEES